MGDAVKVKFGEDSDSDLVTIDVSATINIRMTSSQTDSGKPNVKEYLVTIDGDIRKTQDENWDDVITLSNELTDKDSPRRLRIIEGSTNRIDWKPEDFAVGPLVREFEFKGGEPGAGHNRWPYRMVLFVRKGSGNTGGGETPDTYELHTSLEVVEEEGETVEKHWVATAKAKNVDNAVASVTSFRPSRFTRGSVRRHYQDAMAEGSWSWFAERDKIPVITEEIRVVDGSEDWIISTQVGLNAKVVRPPNLHRAVSEGWTAEVIGTVRGPSSNMSAPSPHWTEGPGQRRRRALEIQTAPDPVLEDKKRGIWALRYHEVWVFTKRPPKPSHGQHREVQFFRPPPDGKIANEV